MRDFEEVIRDALADPSVIEPLEADPPSLAEKKTLIREIIAAARRIVSKEGE